MSSVPSEVSKYMGNAVKLSEIWGSIFSNVKSYGAKGDRTTDDTQAFVNAMASITGEGTILLPSGTYRIASNMTIPSNICIYFTNGGMIAPDSGATVTINGEIIAELTQIFAGLGTVTGVMKVTCVYPQWWGVKGDGTDETTKIQSSINAALSYGGSSVFFPTGVYSATHLNNLGDVNLFGDNASLTIGGQEYKVDNVSKVDQSGIVYNRAVSEIASVFPIDGLKQARKAVESGTLRVMFWGDSITEGADIFDARESYANRFDNALRTSLKGVTVTSANYSLGSRYSTQSVDPNYKGLASEPSDPSLGFFRPWSVVGQSWIDAVKAFAPDLIIYAFGMNDAGYNPTNGDKIIADNIQTLKTAANTWNTVPSIVLVTPILPTKDTTLYSQSQNMTKATARAIRESGYNSGFPVADAERLYEVLRDGYDDVTRSTQVKESNFQGYNTSDWIGDKSGFTLTGSTLTPINTTPRMVTRNRPFYNGTIQVDVKPVNVSDTAWINYRDDSLGTLTVLVSPNGGGAGAGSVGLYRGDTGTLIQQVTGLTIPLGQFKQVRVEVNGSKHTVYFDGAKIMDSVITYHKMSNGNVSIGSKQSSAVFSNLIITYADAINTEAPFTEKSLLSPTGINHPSALGHAIVYIPSLNGVISYLSTSKIIPPWIAPTLLNSWVNYGSPEATVGYYKDSNNIVRLKGMVKSGAASPLFTLPVGYRPLETQRFPGVAVDLFSEVVISAAGVVSLTGSNVWSSISGITFRAEQ